MSREDLRMHLHRVVYLVDPTLLTRWKATYRTTSSNSHVTTLNVYLDGKDRENLPQAFRTSEIENNLFARCPSCCLRPVPKTGA